MRRVLSPLATGLSTPASIAIDYTGKFVYVANRGGTTIAMFSLDNASGALTLMAGTATAGLAPSSITTTTDLQ